MLNRMDFKDKFSKHFKIVIKFKKCILRILGSRILKLSTQISWNHSILDWKSLVKVFCPVTYPINRFILGQIVIAVYIGRMKFRDLKKAQQVQCYIVTCRSLDTQVQKLGIMKHAKQSMTCAVLYCNLSKLGYTGVETRYNETCEIVHDMCSVIL